jgi:hypothetical protein
VKSQNCGSSAHGNFQGAVKIKNQIKNYSPIPYSLVFDFLVAIESEFVTF